MLKLYCVPCDSFLSHTSQVGCASEAVLTISGFPLFREPSSGAPGDNRGCLCVIWVLASPRELILVTPGGGQGHWVSQDGQVPSICLPVIQSITPLFSHPEYTLVRACITPSVTRGAFSLLCKPLLVMATHSEVWSLDWTLLCHEPRRG